MATTPGRSFVEQAFGDGVPTRVLLHRCQNWGIVFERAVILAEEATAEAHRRLLDRNFESYAHYRSSVTQTAIRVLIDILRRERRRRTLPLDEELAAPVSIAGPDYSDLAKFLSMLSEMERVILRLTFEEERTLDEIADRVLPPSDSSLNARRLQIKRKRDLALRRLRNYFDRYRSSFEEGA